MIFPLIAKLQRLNFDKQFFFFIFVEIKCIRVVFELDCRKIREIRRLYETARGLGCVSFPLGRS